MEYIKERTEEQLKVSLHVLPQVTRLCRQNKTNTLLCMKEQ